MILYADYNQLQREKNGPLFVAAFRNVYDGIKGWKTSALWLTDSPIEQDSLLWDSVVNWCYPLVAGHRERSSWMKPTEMSGSQRKRSEGTSIAFATLCQDILLMFLNLGRFRTGEFSTIWNGQGRGILVLACFGWMQSRHEKICLV